MKNKATHGTGDPENPPDDPEQSKRFEETARLLEVDESNKLFERALKVMKPLRPAPKPEALK